jgi:hypothetical protein
MTGNDLFFADSRSCFDIIDILGVVAQEHASFLKQADELMCWRKSPFGWNQLASVFVKLRWIKVEVLQVKQLFWLCDALFSELAVEARRLGAEIWDAKTRGNLRR